MYMYNKDMKQYEIKLIYFKKDKVLTESFNLYMSLPCATIECFMNARFNQNVESNSRENISENKMD